jgi:epoxide hydrolase 4
MITLHTGRGDFETIIEGPEDGAVIVLLHGFPELNLSWRHQIPELAAAGYRVVAPNQRGYSGSVRDGSYATADLAADVVAMLDAVGAESAVVVGHDWGGAVAWTVAQLYPGRVTALVAMNCPPPRVLVAHLLRSPRQLRKSWYMFFFQLPVLPERFVSRSMPGMLRGGSYVRQVWDREALTPYGEAFATESDVRGPINWYRAAFTGALRGALRSPARTSHPIAIPVLIIWGVHDPFLGQEMVSPEALRGTLSFPNEATVVPIESAGHFVQNEAAEEVTAALLAWLASNAPVAP